MKNLDCINFKALNTLVILSLLLLVCFPSFSYLSEMSSEQKAAIVEAHLDDGQKHYFQNDDPRVTEIRIWVDRLIPKVKIDKDLLLDKCYTAKKLIVNDGYNIKISEILQDMCKIFSNFEHQKEFDSILAMYSVGIVKGMSREQMVATTKGFLKGYTNGK